MERLTGGEESLSEGEGGGRDVEGFLGMGIPPFFRGISLKWPQPFTPQSAGRRLPSRAVMEWEE